MPFHRLRAALAVVATCLATALTPQATAATITLNATVRDFCGVKSRCPQGYSRHPDFQRVIAPDYGVVGATLGADNKPVYILSGASATITSKQRFDQFFNDTPGVNMTTTVPLTFHPTSSGQHRFEDMSFFPLDGLLLGNQGRRHNYWFTLELSSMFTYQPGQRFAITGDDDIWLFIDRRLVLDQGGVLPARSGAVNLDTLGLMPGQNYRFDLFFAERHETESKLRITTSIALRQVPEPGAIALVAVALAAFGWSVRAARLRTRH